MPAAEAKKTDDASVDTLRILIPHRKTSPSPLVVNYVAGPRESQAQQLIKLVKEGIITALKCVEHTGV